MTASRPDTVTIGSHHIPMATATSWVATYTDARINRHARSPFAYPAYDQYRAGDNHPSVLDDADLLAPALLNVTISIQSFYALQRHRHQLQDALAAEELSRPLAAFTDEQIGHHIGGIFGILDEGEPVLEEADEATSSMLPGIGGTKLSKVLHRKRPSSIPLHDRWVWACYVGETGDPVPRVRQRTWREYMTLVAQAMARDLRDQPTQFDSLQAASKADPPLTDLRLLDILAWNAGQHSRASSTG